MKEIKLEIIRFKNEDVIATSVSLCRKAKGIAFYNGEKWEYYMNDSGSGNPNNGTATYSGWQPDTSKYYHVNENGVILKEECPLQNREMEIYYPENHNIGPY